MAVGRISGPLLKANLIRNGIDLAFETDLLYLDVNNQRVGIKTTTPQYELDVNGTVKSSNTTVDARADIGDITISGSTIQSNQEFLNLGTLDNVVYQNKAIIDDVEIEGNVIRTNNSNANLEFRPNGTGSVEIFADMNVDGSIHATGNISADGDITIGDANTDNIVFNAEIASNIVPDQDNTFTLGSDPTSGGKQWSDIWVQNFTAGSITSNALVVDGIDLTLRQGNIYYVAENGDDTKTGTHTSDPFASLKHALSQATAGDLIHVYPGVYTEQFPLTVPVGVSVKGQSIRSVKIVPTNDTRYNDAFLLNGESTIEDLTVADFYSGKKLYEVTQIDNTTTFRINVGTAPFAHTYVSGGTITADDSTSLIANITNAVYDHTTGEIIITTDVAHDTYQGANLYFSDLIFSCNGGNRTFPDNGYAFRFATDFEVTTRSPYIKNITVITKGTTITADDPRGFLSGDAGKGAYIDGAYATPSSREASMLFHSATFICPGVDAITCTNGVRVEWLNSFTYFANRSFHCFDSNDGKYGQGKTRIRLSGVTGTFQAGDTVTFTSTDASTVINATVDSIDSIDSNVLLIDGKDTDLIGFDTTPQSISAVPSGATATTIENVDVREFGAEVRMIGSASVYGNYGLWGDGPGVIIYAIGHNLAYIGNGKEVTNEPLSVNQEDEVIELNGAKVRFNSVDHKGDFRVGDLFYVNQEDGTVEFALSALNIDLTSGLTITTGSDTTFINGQRIDTGNLRISGNTVESLSGVLNLDSASGVINLKDDVNITGNLDVTGNVTIGGNITVGDEDTDSIQIVAGINSNLLPDATSTYSLGSSSKLWSNLWVDQVQVDDIEINTNYIRTTSSNSDLELRANGTGNVYIPTNDVVIDQDLTVNTTVNLANTNITGTITHVGDYNQTGDTTVSSAVSVGTDLTVNADARFENIDIIGNVITTSDSNSDLELRANGTGEVVIPNNNVNITNNLTVQGTISADSISNVEAIQANSFTTGDILIDDNFITTTLSNSNLELRTSGTGSIVIDDISIRDATISSATNIVLDPTDENVIIDSTGSLQLPVGTTLERPTPVAGQIRYNSDLTRFEGYNGTNWIQLNGLQDLDGDTRVTAELTEGANDDIIRFYIANTLVADIDATRLRSDKIVINGTSGDITLDNNEISTSSTDLQLSAAGSNSVNFENFSFNENTITNNVSGAVTNFVTTGQGYVQFDGATGVVLPVGDNTTRPPGVEGMIRFNTEDSRVELYDGTSWVSVAGASGGISFADAEEIAIEKVLIFG